MLTSQSRLGARLPWVNLLSADLQLLYCNARSRLVGLGDPSTLGNLDRWVSFISAFPGDFKAAIRSVVVAACDLDDALAHKLRLGAPAVPAVVAAFRCQLCSSTFGFARGLATHQRVAHKQRSSLRVFLDSSGQCPVCAVQFPSRIHLLAHVSEKRRRGKSSARTCREVLELGEVPALAPETIAALDAADRAARSLAKKHGRSKPVALVRAQRSRIRAVPDCKRPFSEVDCMPAVPSLHGIPTRRLRFKQAVS